MQFKTKELLGIEFNKYVSFSIISKNGLWSFVCKKYNIHILNVVSRKELQILVLNSIKNRYYANDNLIADNYYMRDRDIYSIPIDKLRKCELFGRFGDLVSINCIDDKIVITSINLGSIDERDKPLYKHDCNQCDFIYSEDGYDYYYCKEKGFKPTIVMRASDKPYDYISGLNLFKGSKIYRFLIDAKIIKEIDNEESD